MRELTMDEVGEVDGAGNISTGIGLIGLGVAFAVGAGIATLALPVALAASPIIAGVSVGLTGFGGGLIGTGIIEREEC